MQRAIPKCATSHIAIAHHRDLIVGAASAATQWGATTTTIRRDDVAWLESIVGVTKQKCLYAVKEEAQNRILEG